jgi:hypothetical protein
MVGLLRQEHSYFALLAFGHEGKRTEKLADDHGD